MALDQAGSRLLAALMAVMATVAAGCGPDGPETRRFGTLTLPGTGELVTELQVGERGLVTVNLVADDGAGGTAPVRRPPSYLVCDAVDAPSGSGVATPPNVSGVDFERLEAALEEVHDAYPDPSPDRAARYELCKQFLEYGPLRFSLHDAVSGAPVGEVSRPSAGSPGLNRDAGGFDLAYFHGLEPGSRLMLTVRAGLVGEPLGPAPAPFDVRYTSR